MSELTEELKLELQNYNQGELTSAFINACQNNDVEFVRYLLTSKELKERVDVHAKNDMGFRLACLNDCLQIVRYLLTSDELKEHADIHAENDEGFQWACAKDCLDIIEYLLTFSGNQYIDFQKTEYNLDWAINKKNYYIVQAMIISLYKNDRFTYIENMSKVEKYCEKHGLNFQAWQEEMVKEDIDINSHTTELFL